MKMKPEDYEGLKVAVLSSHVYPLREKYEKAGLSAKRWQWDCLHTAWNDQVDKYKFFDTVYQYLNDSHIDTALRNICKGG